MSNPPTPTVSDSPVLDPMDPRLDVFRPDPEVVKQYVSRILPGGIKDTDYLMEKWRERKNILLKGDTQSGKTMVLEVVACLAAEELGFDKPLPIFNLSGSSGVTDFDLFGQNAVYADGENKELLVWLPGILDLATKIPHAILMLDEPTMMEDLVTASLHPVCDHRRAYINRNKAEKIPGDGFAPEMRHVDPTVWICGSYNVGYRSTAPLPEAFANRFEHLTWDYDETVEEQILHYGTVREFAKEIRLMRHNGTVRTPIGLPIFIQFEADLAKFGVEFAFFMFCGILLPDEKTRVETHVENISMLGKIEDEIEQTEIFGGAS